ncbi:MAG TPA: VTT domain-containing protein [Terriglobales bacterium]|nr:VTT domain-containing protein [Terriglobales bacterium]
MHTISHALARYTQFIWGLLQPLGSWGVFAIAAIDGSLLGMPLDPVVAGYVYKNPHKFLLYVIMASAGSAVGSIVLYVIGYKGGEVLLQKRMPPQKFESMRRTFDRHEFWALMFPAMLPPPFPFKLFVLAAAAFEMNFGHFELAIFAGRFARFLILALLTIKFGPQVVSITAQLVHQHLAALLIAVAALIAGYVLLRRRRKSDLSS